MSPIAIAFPLPSLLNATHDPRASAGFRVTPSSETLMSLRGKLYFITPSGCSAPARPIAVVTAVQSSDADVTCAWAIATDTQTIAIAKQERVSINPQFRAAPCSGWLERASIMVPGRHGSG